MIQGKQIADNSIPPSKIIGGTGGAKKVPFTFATPSPVHLGPIVVGTEVYLAQIVIEIAFNDPAATITFGTIGDPTLFLTPSDSHPSIVDQYQSLESAGPAASDTIILTINPGTSTQGSGYLIYNEAA